LVLINKKISKIETIRLVVANAGLDVKSSTSQATRPTNLVSLKYSNIRTANAIVKMSMFYSAGNNLLKDKENTKGRYRVGIESAGFKKLYKSWCCSAAPRDRRDH
jgi:hypothetical protein